MKKKQILLLFNTLILFKMCSVKLHLSFLLPIFYFFQKVLSNYFAGSYKCAYWNLSDVEHFQSVKSYKWTCCKERKISSKEIRDARIRHVAGLVEEITEKCLTYKRFRSVETQVHEDKRKVELQIILLRS